jgi:hypothetical protein
MMFSISVFQSAGGSAIFSLLYMMPSAALWMSTALLSQVLTKRSGISLRCGTFAGLSGSSRPSWIARMVSDCAMVTTSIGGLPGLARMRLSQSFDSPVWIATRWPVRSV